VSTSTPQFTGHQTQMPERRAHPRVFPRTLIYVACGESNGGMVLNVNDDGMAISMAIPVSDEAYSTLHVRMNGSPQSIEVHGRLAWTTKSKKRAGIQLIDVSEEQRRQIREWLAQEGVRDVNLLPRVSEPAASILPAPADRAVQSVLPDKPHSELSAVAASTASTPAVVADPRASLLTGFGGTPPEFLGPAQNEASLTADVVDESPSSQGPKPKFVGFRENEWDLASITMVPRKRSKPQGLSALGLLLLWIAIPSFGIGIIVGLRPLQYWLLSRGYTIGKNIPRVDAPEPQIVNARDASPEITSGNIDASGPQSIHTVETPANSPDIKTSAATKSFVSTPAFVDTKLLNSMSTQELHALKVPATAALRENSKGTGVSKLNSKDKANIIAKDVSSSPAAVDKLVTRTNTLVASANARTNVKASGSPGLGTNAAATKNLAGHENTSGSRPAIQPVANASSASSLSIQLPDRSIAPNSGTAGNPTSSPSSVSDASRNNNAVLTASRTQPISSSTATASVPASSSMPAAGSSTSATAPRIAPNVRPSITPTAAASPRPATPTPATNFAPVHAQPPLHGVMLVARKNNESFLLRLPVESVAGGRSVSVQMQRFVMVPAKSRWHHHGPIAKLAIGELLTQVAANQVETIGSARPGDAVTVRAFVDKNGSVEDLKPVSGRFALMPQVMHDVREWQFDQTLVDGKPVESEVNITLEFRSSAGPQQSRSREIQAQNSFKP
jgi:hypothetical protein